MFVSKSRGRFWRPLRVVVFGAAVGLTVLAPMSAGGASRATLQRSASCAGIDFVPNSSSMFWASSGTMRYGGTGYFFCNLNLPNRAQITKVVFTVRDDRSDAQISACALVSNDLRPAYATSAYVHASTPDTGIGATPGIVQLQSATVYFPIIDNTHSGYWLQCGSIEVASTAIGIYGAKVLYRISAANG